MKRIKPILTGLAFLLFLFLVIKGQTIRNIRGLALMGIGLGGLLVQLYLYNKKYI